MTPNRIAAYLTVAANLLGALAPLVANMDTTSLVGVVTGLVGVNAVFLGWLKGWQQHEQNIHFSAEDARRERWMRERDEKMMKHEASDE